MIQDKGSNYQFYNHTEKANIQKSVFDLSFLNTTTINNGGEIIPLGWFETVPGDKFSLNFEAMIRVMPQVIPLFSRQRLFIHAYWSRNIELWNDAETYYDKGYTGNVSLKKPTISSDNFDETLWNSGNGVVTAGSLADYLELPIGAKYSELQKSGVSALPFMMYERIYKEYYMNPNYYTENRQWLPHDDGDLRLNTDGEIISVKNNPDIPEGQEAISFGKIHYRDWTQDYFTSALPWPQRGTAKQLSTQATFEDNAVYLNGYNENNEQISHDKAALVNYTTPSGAIRLYNTENGHFAQLQTTTEGNGANAIGTPEQASGQYATPNKIWLETAGTTQILTGINANDLRELFLNQQELETMARTDGSYAQFGLAFFGVVSEAAKSYKPQYIGGTYQNITFGEVLQNAPSTGEGVSPLGSFAGRGGMTTQGDLGTVFCDDYGIIMICASIVPDTYYSQGVERKWTRQIQEDEFLPDRAKLGMQPILNEELVFENGEEEQNKDVWAWQNRFDELRYTTNKIHGKIADPSAASFYPYTQARHFSDLPGYSQEFALMDDVRKDYLTSSTEVAYLMQSAIKVRAVRPLPYKAIPAELI